MSMRRSSIQVEQEQRSRHQLAERLSDIGWHFTSPSPDLGEDFIVEIYHEGKNTGVVFYIQEKSVTNLEERRTKDNRLVYTVKVRDLKHWEDFSLPVVIVIWDVNLREGKWGLVKDLISYLDQNNPKWRKNKKDVQVYFPWKNDMTNEGLKKLKGEIGKRVYPLISSGKDLSLTMKLAFPKTPDGLKLQNAFDLHLKEGEPVTLRGDVIQELKFSDWWESWFGELDLKQAELRIGESSQQRPVLISFKIIPSNGKTISLSKLEFRIIRVGTELVKFSNEHTSCPLLINLTLRKQENGTAVSQIFKFRHVGGDPHEIINFTDFLRAIETGGKLQLEFHDMKQLYTTDFPPSAVSGLDLKFYDLVQKLCIVQDKTGYFFSIPDQGISHKDAQSILELYEIVEKGIVNYTSTVMTLELTVEGLKLFLDTHKQGLPIHLKMTTSESYVELFGEEIQTGPMIRETTGFIAMSIHDLERVMNSLSSKEALVVKLINVNGSETFSNWLPKQ